MTELSQEMQDKLTKVCLCKGISRETIKKAIAEGADTLDKLQKATGAGTGSCHGGRCTSKLEELLREAGKESK